LAAPVRGQTGRSRSNDIRSQIKGVDGQDKALDEGVPKGWTVVSMKDDWRTIFPK
jgi:hypothetical protein